MGYAAAVGTMVLNEVVYVNKRGDSRMDAINTSLTRLERDVEIGHGWSRRTTNKILELERGQAELEREQMDMNVEQGFMRAEMTLGARASGNGCLHVGNISGFGRKCQGTWALG